MITIDGTHRSAGVRTVTSLNTGLGNDVVTVDLDAGEDDFFVLDTQGAYEHLLPTRRPSPPATCTRRPTSSRSRSTASRSPPSRYSVDYAPGTVDLLDTLRRRRARSRVTIDQLLAAVARRRAAAPTLRSSPATRVTRLRQRRRRPPAARRRRRSTSPRRRRPARSSSSTSRRRCTSRRSRSRYALDTDDDTVHARPRRCRS